MTGRSNPPSPKALTHVGADRVGHHARRGAVWSALQIAARNILSIGTTAVLSRVLSPDDYGLMGMVGTLTALMLVFSDMGLSTATVQKRTLNELQVSNLFWINLGLGLLLWCTCIALAPHVASFYSRPELTMVTIVMGGTFLLTAAGAQPFALLRRKMDFRTIALIETFAAVSAAASGIVAAAYGLGYWSLVIQAIVGQLVRLLSCYPLSGMRLFAPAAGAGTKEMVRFGGLLALNGVLIYTARNLDNVLIGRYWGAENLGFYTRAYFLMLLPSMVATSVLSNLMITSLAALQADKARFADSYRRAVRLVAVVGCPLAAGLALTAPEAVRLVYGSRWTAVVEMLVWLSIAGVTQPIYNTTGWLFTAAGRSGLYFILTIVNATVLGATFWISVQFGTLQVAQAYGIVMGLVLLFPALWIAHFAARISFKATLLVLAPVAGCVAFMILSVLLVDAVGRHFHAQWGLLLALKILVGFLSYTIACFALLKAELKNDLLPMLPRSLSLRLAGARG